MLLFGVCINDIEKAGINWGNIVGMLKKYDHDRYSDFLDDMEENSAENDSRDIEFWFDQYESEGRSGLGAFLYDVIREQEKVEIDIDDPDGVYIGISAAAPWEFHPSVRNLSEEQFTAMISKYICQITDAEIVIRWWKVDDDLDW